MTTIKEMVANDRKVRFTHYKSGELWYVTECGFSFPVPITDAGDGSFLAEDKALLFRDTSGSTRTRSMRREQPRSTKARTRCKVP